MALIIKSKILESCKINLCTFLIERSLESLDNIIKLGDHYYAAHSEGSILKEQPGNVRVFVVNAATTGAQRKKNVSGDNGA